MNSHWLFQSGVQTVAHSREDWPRQQFASNHRRRLLLERLEGRYLLSGLITGVVYQDFNGNGVRDLLRSIPTASGFGTTGVANDRGLGGITVTAVDSAGVARGAATTGSDGGYSLSAVGTGPYRIEFMGIPTGFSPGPNGPQNGTTVRFVPDGNSPNIDLGLVRPPDHSQDNPDLVTSVYVFGDQVNGPNRDQPVLVSFPYNSGAADGTPGEAPYQVPATHALSIPANQIGTTWGLAFNQSTSTIYAAAFTKKFAGYGPNGNGAIYQTGTTGSTATLFADLNQIFGAGTAGVDFRGTPAWVAQGGFFTDGFNTGWDAVGKSSLGGIDVSADGRFLYAMNLADRNLYILPTSGPLNATTVRRVPVPNPITAANSADPNLDFRPFAVTFHEGKVYVGAINSAESTQDRNNLRAFVLVFDPTTGAFAPTPAFQFDLNYPRGLGNAFAVPPASANWLPWTPTFRNLSQQSQFEPDTIYPQPWLTGLAFDAAGNLVLGIRDRTGDEVGVQTPDDPADPTTLRRGIAVGDTLRASFDPVSGVFTLENNGSVGGNTSAGAGNNQGPGGGEFYFQDFTPGPGGAVPVVHDEMSVGGVLQIPGFPDVATTTINPNREPSFFSRGGVRWFNNADGRMTRGYEEYYSGPVSTAAITFSKANGVGDLIALSDPAPLEIGNRVWLDLNHDGLQGANEPVVAGATVRLYGPGGNLLATAVTDTNGNYFFSNGPGISTPSSIYNLAGLTFNTTGLSVRLDNPVDFGRGGPLFGLIATIANAGDTRAIDSSGSAFGPTDVRAAVSIGGPGQNDHTLDFGLVPAADLAVTKTVSNATPSVGDTIAFTITLTNLGPGDATNVVLRDLLPAGLTFVSASPSQGSYDSASGIWNVGAVATSTPLTLVINARVIIPDPITNFVAIVTSDQVDPNPDNNSDTVTETPLPADLVLTKTASASIVRFGDTLTYTILITNQGPGTAKNVVVRDLLPAGTLFVSASHSPITQTGSDLVFSLGDLVAGASGLVDVVVRIVQQVVQITNRADVTSNSHDPDPSNNSDGTTVTVEASPAAPVRVDSLARFGFHHQPTLLEVGFTGPLDAARAGNLSNYSLTLIAHGGRLRRRIPLAAASYQSTTQTVLLRPSRLMPLRFHYRLVINASSPTGVTDSQGRLIDGNGDGVPGGDYIRDFGREVLRRAERSFGRRWVTATRELGRGLRIHGKAVDLLSVP